MSKLILTLLFGLTFNLFTIEAYALISPIRRNQDNKPLLTNCENIRLVSQVIDLYHHPIGIWMISCKSEFQNLYSKNISQEMAFNSGFDIGMVEDELYCDEFNNFRLYVDGKQVKSIKMKEQCSNYVERIGINWTNDDNTGIGFLNTWRVDFKPEETKQILVTCSFIIKKPPIIVQPQLKERWYTEQLSWIKHEYSKRMENDFKLPLNMGSFWALYVDSLIIRSYSSDQWLTIEEQKNRKYDPEEITIFTYCDPVGFYSPHSLELRLLTEDDLIDKTATELKILRNSFFAKYGRIFQIEWLKFYFSKQPWYYENSNYNNWYLTDFDKQNIKFIFEYEKQGKPND